MLKAELLEIIANGENSGVEFKRDDIRPEQLAREVVALANLDGGRILLGVEDSGEITGIKSKDLSEWVLKEGLNRSVFLRRSRHGGVFRGRRCGFCLLSLTLSYFFVALMPFVRLFLHNRRTTTY